MASIAKWAAVGTITGTRTLFLVAKTVKTDKFRLEVSVE